MTDNGYESMKKSFWYLIVLLLCLGACEQPVLEQGVYSEDLFLKDQYTLNPLGDTIRFTVNAVGAWSLSKPSWLNADRLSGRGMQTITLIADANMSGSPQTGEITINSSEVKRIQVSQANPYAFLDNSRKDSFRYKWNGAVNLDDTEDDPSVPLASNLYWRMEPVGDEAGETHFLLSQYEGFGDATIRVTPRDSNLDTLEWHSYYRLTSYVDENRTRPVPDGIPDVRHDTLSIVQQNYSFLIGGVSGRTIVFERSNFNEETFSVMLDPEPGASASWKILDNPGSDWLDVKKQDASTLHLVPLSPNATKYDRQCQVSLQASSGALRYLDVLQERYLFYFEKDGKEIDLLDFANEGGVQDAVFVSSGPWRVESSPTGVEFNPSSGEGGETPVQITVSQQNLELNPRTRNVLVRSADSGLAGVVLRDTLVLRQPEFKFQVTTGLDTLGSAEGSSRQFVLESSGPWQVDAAPSWVDISPSSAESGGRYTVTVTARSENTSEKDHRTSTIRLVCPLNSSALRREFPVVQMRTMFDLSTDNFPSISAYDDPLPVCATELISSQDWSVTEWPDWVTPSVTSGNASEKPVWLYFTIKTNTAKSSRSGRVVIRNQAGKTRQITFSQDGLNYSVSGVEFTNQAATGATRQTQVSCYPTVSWSVLNCPSWVTPSRQNGRGNGTIDFTIQPNPGTVSNNGSEARSGSLSVHNDVTGESVTVSFSQSGYKWTVSNADSYSFGAFKGEKSSEFTITSSGSWRIETPEWIQASKSRGSAGTDRVSLTTIQDNAPATSRRTGTVTVVCEDFGSLNKVFTVQQEKYNLSANPTSLSIKKANGSTGTFTVTADGTWSAKSDATWLNISPSNGSAGTTVVTVKATSKNGTRNTRTATVTINDTKYSSIPAISVTVTQQK